jgi:hypothetical protein
MEGYLAGTQTAAEFRQSAAKEADSIINNGETSSTDLTGFTDKILDTIGSGLQLEAGHYLAFHQRTPALAWPLKGTVYAVLRKKDKWMRRVRSASKTIQLVRNAFVNGAVGFNSDSDNDKKREKEIGNGYKDDPKKDATEEMLPDLMDMAFAFILSDIANAVQGACWRLFFDSDVDSATRLRRAEALDILGQEFVQRGRTDNRGSNTTGECVDKSARSDEVREKMTRAFEISQMKVRYRFVVRLTKVEPS